MHHTHGRLDNRSGFAGRVVCHQVGLCPIVTLQYRSTTLYQVSYQIQQLFFRK
jgi:hypothetical protein